MIETDYRKCDEIWRRVSPSLEPYPKDCSPQRPAGQLTTAGGCCMGDAARDELDALQGFLREAISDAQTYRCLATCAPGQEGRRLMHHLAAGAAALDAGQTLSIIVYDQQTEFQTLLRRAGFAKVRGTLDMELGHPAPAPGADYYAIYGGDMG